MGSHGIAIAEVGGVFDSGVVVVEAAGAVKLVGGWNLGPFGARFPRIFGQPGPGFTSKCAYACPAPGHDYEQQRRDQGHQSEREEQNEYDAPAE